MRRTPATCPHLPYTTLFRSLVDHIKTELARLLIQSLVQPFGNSNRQHFKINNGVGARTRTQGQSTNCGKADRKSTRLNSSHVAISYAVFCLKKKKNGMN